MRKTLLLGVLFVSVIAVTIAQPKYRTVSVKDVQIMPLDSLKQCDVLQTAQPARWLLQTSPYFRAVATQRETVEVVGQVVVPPKVVTFTGAGFTVLLRDTSKATENGQWSGLFCRVAPADTTSLINQGFLGLKQGDVIRIRGWVDEFPNGPSGSAYSGSMVSATQFVPIGGLQLIDEGKPIPKPAPLDLGTFYRGTYPGGSIRWSTGEEYEAAYVEFTNLTVTSIVNATNGTFSIVDASGNEVAMLDVSKWFTSRGHRDPLSTYKAPTVFQKIDTIRGYITTNSGTEEPRGYRIAPVFPGDIVYGKFLPGIGTHRRNNVALGSKDTAKISVKAFVQTGAVGKIAAVLLKKSLNNGPFTVDSMKYNAADTTYIVSIGPQPVNTFVKYFFQAYDTSGSYSTYASSATGSASSDTSKGLFFYYVLDRSLTISDIQYTPFPNGRSGYLGAQVSVSGVITADTSDIDLGSSGALPWYIQTGNQGWSGIWVTGVDSLLRGLRKGDSVSVNGTVLETFDVTNIGAVTAATKLASGKSLPAPVVRQTGNFAFGTTNGNPIAEQWEGMLVRFNNVTVTDVYPTFSDQREYLVTDGSGSVLVRIDGKNTYSNISADTSVGKTIIKVGDKFSYIQGVMWYDFNRYKLVPRGNSDFGTRTTGIEEDPRAFVPKEFVLNQNYPNPFNPSTTISYNLPSQGNVTLKIFNLLGQQVKELVNQFQTAGHYTLRFDAAGLPSGVYLYRLVTESGALTKKMLMLK